MTKIHHPKDRLERLKVSEKKSKPKSARSHVRQRKIVEIREEEANHELQEYRVSSG